MKKKTLWGALVVLALIAAVAVAIVSTGNARKARYEQAVANLEAGNYAEAMDGFKALNRYGDAPALYARAKEGRAAQLKEAEDWDGLLALIDKGDPDYYLAVEEKAAAIAAEAPSPRNPRLVRFSMMVSLPF